MNFQESRTIFFLICHLWFNFLAVFIFIESFDVFRDDICSIEKITVIINALLHCEVNAYIFYNRFLLHWLKNVKSMEEQCVLGQTMAVFLTV